MAYTSARGIASEEIVVDGDGFVTELTSKGPEELIPGQVLDTVDFRVYDRTSDGSSIISSHNCTGDGVTTGFFVTNLPSSQTDLFVKVNGSILDATLYTVNYQTKQVVITTPPPSGAPVHISTMSNNGENIIDFDRFIGDGSTSQFVTPIVYKTGLSYVLRVDGETVTSDLAETDSTYEIPGRVVFKLGSVPNAEAIIE